MQIKRLSGLIRKYRIKAFCSCDRAKLRSDRHSVTQTHNLKWDAEIDTRHMPVRDRYHENVKNALIKDGWTITDDPLHLKYGKRDMYVDLGAERLIAAEKQGQRIAIEIKTFASVSDMTDLEQALGQYLAYRSVMNRTNENRFLYLAVHDEVYADIFDEPIAKLLVEDYQINVVVFKPAEEIILKWIPWNNINS